MSSNHKESGPVSSPSTAPDHKPGTDASSGSNGHSGLPAGWHRLPIKLPGARLYRITPSDGGLISWQAEMTLNGEVKHRRCVSELHALWWLAALVEPHPSPARPDPVDRIERLRAHFISHP